MGFFAPTPKVTDSEWRRIRSRLLQSGLSHSEVRDVEAVVLPELEESGSGRGVDKWEVKNILSRLKNHRQRHGLTDEQIDRVEDVLKREL